MPIAVGKSAGVQFSLALDELQGGVDFLRASSRLRPRLGPFVNWQAVVGDAKNLINDFLELKEVELSPHYRGMIVVLCGAFEEFVRRLVQDAVARINEKAAAFDDVPETVRIQNVHLTGRALLAAKDPPDHIAIDSTTLASGLSTCVSGAVEFKLNAEAFSLFITNLTPSHLDTVCRSFGVEIDWDFIGGLATFEALFGTTGARATGKQAAARLKQFVSLRNRIAHTGAGGITVSDMDVEDYIKFFRAFAPRLVTYVEGKLRGH